MSATPIKFRKRPVVIEAMQWDGTDDTSLAIRHWAEDPTRMVAIVDTEHIQHMWDFDLGAYRMPNGKTVFAPARMRCLVVLTLEGEMVAEPGDWIILGVQNEMYPIQAGHFRGYVRT